MARYSLQWLCCQPTPYNDLLFRSLAADPDIDLTGHFREAVLSSHPWRTRMAQGFKSRTYRRVLGLDWHVLRLAALDRQSVFVIGGWAEPTVIALINLLSVMRRPFVIWTDTPQANRKRDPVKAYLRETWLRWVFDRAMRVMGTGTPALQALQQMGAPEPKMVNFPYFVDLDCFRPQPQGMDTQRLVFVSSGRLIREKGYDLALVALATVFRSRKQLFHYLIAGTGPEQEHLLQLAGELGISQSVELVGWLEPQVLPNFFASADIFLHPARIEPYGVAVLEAMASGLVVIGSDATAAIVDRIRNGVNGFIHQSDNVDDLARRITEVLDKLCYMSPVRVAARETAEQWSVGRGIQIIKSVLENAHG